MDTDQLFPEAVNAHQRGERRRARDLYENVLAHNPAHGPARYNLTLLLLEDSKWQEALDQVDLLLGRYPVHAGAHYGRGRALAKLSRHEEALVALMTAARLAPGDPEIHLALGNAYAELERKNDARSAYERVIALAPGHPSGYINLGRLYIEVAKYREARSVAERGLAIAADNPHLNFLLGQALIRLNEFEAGKDALAKAVRLAPDFTLARSYLMRAARFVSDWATEEQCFSELRQALARDSAEFMMPAAQALYFPFTRREQRLIMNRQARLAAARAVRPPAVPRAPRRDGAPLRIGYLSADFRDCANPYYTVDVFEAHDRSAVDVVMYSLANDDSAWNRRCRAAARLFRDISDATIAEAVAQIAHDEIDILVDMSVYTQHVRPEILASRPAPVMAHWFGFPGTAGADWFDYVIADRTIVPAEHLADYAEACAWLPCYQPNRRLDDTSPPSREALGLPRSGVIFCAFNSHRKLDRLTFESWLRILRRTPGSVLWLLEAPAEKRQRLAEHARRFDVAPERLIYASYAPYQAHFPRFGAADLFLDSLIYNAHTVASDALRMGLPLLTVTGETFAARVATSLLRTVGLERLAFTTVAEFEDAAVALATDPAALAALKAEVAAKVRASPLFDPVRFTRHLERAYGEMWRRHAAGLAPESFDVEAK